MNEDRSEIFRVCDSRSRFFQKVLLGPVPSSSRNRLFLRIEFMKTMSGYNSPKSFLSLGMPIVNRQHLSIVNTSTPEQIF